MFVMTIDQDDSTGADDHVPALLTALAHAAPGARLAFERTVGDEVQGVIADPAEVVDVVRTAIRLGKWQVGVGVGEIVEPIPSSTRAATGTAFLRARDAVERAKSRRLPVPVAVTGPPVLRGESTGEATTPGSALTASDAEAVLQLLGGLLERRSALGWAAVDAVLGVEDGDEPTVAGRAARRRAAETRTRSQAAGMLGVTEQALSKRLRSAAWQQECAALPALTKILAEVDR
jgi:hypothetical protein